jgi:para-aminobenzoate synthetase
VISQIAQHGGAGIGAERADALGAVDSRRRDRDQGGADSPTVTIWPPLTYEVCLTNMIEADAPPDAWQAYRFLRRAYPVPFGALLAFGDMSVLSTSPERFLRVDRVGAVESKPIKGTRRRGPAGRT